MWLLNTSTGELKFFNNPSTVRYAILSHVWREGHEQSFQDLQTLRAQSVSHDSTPRARVSAKIRNCCIYAERAGYQWVWIDTCCIDKTSSAELSEAINSMYAWYAHAAVCYAFLDDVREKENPHAFGSTFRSSRWWTRGWTLQELVAPRAVVFLSKSWRFIGTKHSLSYVVQEISGVDREVLVHERALDDVSVARRMSWAARRHTTREEDRAYSLMGLFGVNMPTIYGEGPRAFTRLQEEILKHIPDQSIFAWGPILDNYPFACKGFAMDSDDPRWSSDYTGVSSQDMQAMLAPSPVEFAAAGRIRPIRIAELAHRLGIPLSNPHYLTTSYGIRTQLPILPYQPGAGPALTTPANVSIAVLACEHEDHSIVLLFLRRKDGAQDEHYAGDFVDVRDSHDDVFVRAYFRVAFLATSATGLVATCDVRDVYVHSRVHPAMRMRLPHRGPGAVERVQYSFFMPEWVLGRLSNAGFELRTERPLGSDGLRLELLVLPGLDVSAIFRLTRVTSATFGRIGDERESFTLMIGIGCICQLAQKRRGLDAFWVEVAHSSRLGSPLDPRLRQKWPNAFGASGACTRKHLTYAPVEFGTTCGKLRVSVSPWGGSSSGNHAAPEFNHVVDVDVLDSQDDLTMPDRPSAQIAPSSAAAATLQRAVKMLSSLKRPWS